MNVWKSAINAAIVIFGACWAKERCLIWLALLYGPRLGGWLALPESSHEQRMHGNIYDRLVFCFAIVYAISERAFDVVAQARSVVL